MPESYMEHEEQTGHLVSSMNQKNVRQDKHRKIID